MEMDEDEDGFCKYGTPLKPYEEDEIPSKRPVTVEDQIVRDENGKRRFHGAFTGGFSAGYWNTVGSKEGWTPQQFKSSRSEKAASLPKQSANDFMDEEDLGEFGIAHQRIQTQLDFGEARSGKRKFEVASKGPIPGKPVLQTLLAPTHDKAAARILKTMGWKDGQGIGARLTKREKRRAQERNEKEISGMRRYGCDLGPVGESRDPESSDSDLSDYDITFAPDDFDPFVITPKDNSFGLGYSGLQRAPVLQQSLGIFDALEVVDRKSNKKLSIRGQAFGVGALEEEDDDIYARDDMTRYDFALEDAKKAPILAIKAAPDSKVIEKFQKARESRKAFLRIFRVDIPRNFRPRNWLIKRSRFDPLAPEVAKKLEEEQKYKKMGLGRHDLRPEERGALLGDKPSTSRDDKSREKFKVLEEKSEIPESKIPEEKSKETTKSEAEVLRKNAEQITRKLMKEKDGVFRPFAMDEEKQARYEKFLNFVETPNIKIDDFFFDLQPPSMSEWDRERERKEFMHAKRLYKPLSGLMSDRFVSAGGNSHFEASPIVAEPEKPAQKEIKMRRSKGLWKPHKDLCKRFNVPEPFGGLLVEQKPEKKSKFSVFDYIEIPTNSKTNFARPVLLPSVKKKPVKPPTPVSAKEFFNEEPQRPSIPFAKVEEEPKVEEKPKVVPRVIEPKTELEKKVEEALDKPPQEKKDLFRSIFCDSSDEEDKENPPEAPKQISDSEKLKLVESFVATKSASEFNILRNESPPKGIFKNILEVTRSLPERVQSSSSSSENEEEMAYGPALPQNVPSEDNSKLDEKLERYLKKSSSLEVASRWVEKDKAERKKKKKEKKKHHKHKHKSHKKKDKRK